MKNSFCQILSYLCVAGFLLYWTGNFITAMPPNYLKQKIIFYAPGIEKTFGGGWKLFTPPYTYNDRLYYIIRDTARLYKADTIEVLTTTSIQKKNSAPFNQRENIIDHLLNHSVSLIKDMVWHNKKKPWQMAAGYSDSLYINAAIATAISDINNTNYLTALRNYYRIFISKKVNNPAGKEIKIVITEKAIRPFDCLEDKNFVQRETLIFETVYTPASE